MASGGCGTTMVLRCPTPFPSIQCLVLKGLHRGCSDCVLRKLGDAMDFQELGVDVSRLWSGLQKGLCSGEELGHG